MRYLSVTIVCAMLMFALTSISQADDSPYCQTKSYLARDVAISILDGLDPSKINFAFPNVSNEEEAKEAAEWASQIVKEVLSIINYENDPTKVYNIVKDNCNDPSNSSI